ncbi:hypothetical protein ACJU26_09235 [Acidithiobacillus sp. M4-SHS-6]|uniref:hypothetical protein n=1 Tax=Acidithiobacillus sp. M4-SHS-6 TaxID=3383024 RepID=UPI0039BE2544
MTFRQTRLPIQEWRVFLESLRETLSHEESQAAAAVTALRRDINACQLPRAEARSLQDSTQAGLTREHGR